MKIIDIHKGFPATKQTSNIGSINALNIKCYVYERLSFNLPKKQWKCIDAAFSQVWNKDIGVGGYFYWDEVVQQVYQKLQNQKIIIDFKRVDEVVELMLEGIEVESNAIIL